MHAADSCRRVGLLELQESPACLKNHLQYGVGIATLLVVFLSGAVWFYQKTREVFFYREKVRVVALNSLGSAVIANAGDGEVFLSHLLLWMPGRTSNWIAPDLQIYQSLSPGKFLRKEYGESRIKGNAVFVRGVGSADFETLLARGAASDPCVELVFFETSDGQLADLRAMAGPALNTFDVAGYLEYWSPRRDGPGRAPITGVGVVWHDLKPPCK